MQTLISDVRRSSFGAMLMKIKHPLVKSFFMGWAYPIWLAFSVVVGRALNLEVYFAILDLVLIAIAFYACESMRPILPILMSFLYRISLDHAPGTPNYSDYYRGWKIIVPIIFFVFAVTSLVAMLIRRSAFTKENFKKLPLLIPLSVLSAAFLLSGSFYSGKVFSDFTFALLQVFVFAIVFWLLYLGFKGEDADETCGYFVYVSAVVACILILEVAHLYIFNENVIVDGVINKNFINFGWGISNTCANCLTVLIPICFLGVMRSRKYHYAYFIIGTLALVATAFTLCRNGLLFGSIFYAICLLLSCFLGRNKKIYRYVAVATALGCIAISLIFGEELKVMFANMIAHGLDDNGRFPLWYKAFDGFVEMPVFGKGFFSLLPEATPYASFIPFLAHNTILEVMGAMGAFGLLAYLFYRAATIIPFVKNISIEKVMLFLSVAVLIVESLIDNYILWFAPTFVYNIAILIAIKYNEDKKTTSHEN